MANEELEQLKEEARELGLEFSANIGAAKLQEKIDAYYKSQETSGKEIQEAVAKKEAEEQSEERPAVTGTGDAMAILARDLYEQARKTRIVTIVDNDQRVNNQTTVCKANWSNAYYDLGSRIFPLNTPIEIPQGFIDVLLEVKIPHHIKDPKSQLSSTVMRNRYSITDTQL